MTTKRKAYLEKTLSHPVKGDVSLVLKPLGANVLETCHVVQADYGVNTLYASFKVEKDAINEFENTTHSEVADSIRLLSEKRVTFAPFTVGQGFFMTVCNQ